MREEAAQRRFVAGREPNDLSPKETMMTRMSLRAPRLAAALVLVTAIALTAPAMRAQSAAAPPRPNDSTLEIATDAYIYGYPLLLMYYTQQDSVASGQAKINEFVSAPRLADPDQTTVVRPNNDTLYTQSFLDLTAGPIILHVPDTKGTYYLMQIMDAWSNTIAAPGTRLGDTTAKDFVIVGPNWKGPLPDSTPVIPAPTNTVWILGRTQVDVKSPVDGGCPLDKYVDYTTVHEIQKGYKLTVWKPGASALASPASPVSAKTSPSLTPPQQVGLLTGVQFFQELSELMAANPALAGDGPALAEFKKIGFVPGQPFNPPAGMVPVINEAPKAALEEMIEAAKKLGANENGWSLILSGIGEYGTEYLTRAAVALVGFGANLPEDAIYPSAATDINNNPLRSDKSYEIQFDPVPPVNPGAFWSVTAYDQDGFLVPNGICRYAIHSTDLAIAGQNAVTLLLQNTDAPPPDAEMGYWLPTPAVDSTGTGSNFSLTIRMYWPSPDAFDGNWKPPAIKVVPVDK
jgi:hypothetical protein